MLGYWEEEGREGRKERMGGVERNSSSSFFLEIDCHVLILNIWIP